ncbi:hypothetical protein LCGC14_1849180 [marine sediment metagenome]|uniref:Uncharacterized protein n=1 Tax=marine sediment metagenome TaxID=412755 RepID=A0A0F9JA48_9ZZZZ
MDPIIRIVASLEKKSLEWKIDEHYLTHKKSGVGIWFCSGEVHLKLMPIGLELTKEEKVVLWGGVVSCQKNLLNKLCNKM